ncbi:hypothetical protein Avbf_17261 [Armadillidium vulgare]|nr:hypothetical protein Avbf_17261 [Armadillidium vulgare]
MELEEKYPIDFPQLLKWFCGKMRFFYNKEENVVDRRFVLFKLFKLYVGQGCQDMELRETIEMFMTGTSVVDIRELYAKVCIRSWENRLFKIAVLITEMVSPTIKTPTPDRSQTYRFFRGDAVVSGVDSQKAVRLDRYCVQGNNRKTDGRIKIVKMQCHYRPSKLRSLGINGENLQYISKYLCAKANYVQSILTNYHDFVLFFVSFDRKYLMPSI